MHNTSIAWRNYTASLKPLAGYRLITTRLAVHHIGCNSCSYLSVMISKLKYEYLAYCYLIWDITLNCWLINSNPQDKRSGISIRYNSRPFTVSIRTAYLYLHVAWVHIPTATSVPFSLSELHFQSIFGLPQHPALIMQQLPHPELPAAGASSQ